VALRQKQRQKESPQEARIRAMKRLSLLCAAALLALAAMAPAARAQFGVEDFQLNFIKADESPDLQAGSHPFAVTNILRLTTESDAELGEIPQGSLKDFQVSLPEGLAGAPIATPRCSSADFIDISYVTKLPACSNDSAVGVISAKVLWSKGSGANYISAPVYNLRSPFGVAQKLGFSAAGVPIAIEFRLNPKPPYNVIANLNYIAQPLPILGSRLIVWGNPASPAHNSERGSCIATLKVESTDEIQTTGGSCPSGAKEKAFVTLPTACRGPLAATYETDSWQEPGNFVKGQALSPAMEGCSQLEFDPQIAAVPTTTAAESSSGLNFDMRIDDPGISDPTQEAQSALEKAVVTLPPGVATNPAVATGLSACTLAQYESESLRSAGGCPESSKIGSVQIQTPLVEQTVEGSLYVAKQGDNPFGNLLTIYMVAENAELGVLIQAAGKVEPDPSTGQITTTFDDLPQLPFSHFHLHFREGPRAPLITPATCGTYTTNAKLFPYSNPDTPVTRTSSFEVASDPEGGPCISSSAALPHSPSFRAGTLNSLAGAYSPFVFSLRRPDGSQPLSSITATLPKGLLGRLTGIAYCSEAQLAAAAARSAEGQGAGELTAPSCPTTSQVGSVDASVGAGPEPYQVQGRAYLAGPYKGAPLSLAIITPAVVGPFDLGNVVVRTALRVDPESAQITAVSDPIPSILHGLIVDLRSISLTMDRPGFTLNPTNCHPTQIAATATSLLGQVAPLSQYFQATNCTRLGFGPRLLISLKGKIKRTGHSHLHTVLTYPKGAYANIAAAQVLLPRSQFIDNGSINNPCTRVQFNASACPKSSILGYAKAWSPLLDQPLQGPVYFRSNGGERELPDLVASLGGQIHVDLVGFIDAVQRKGSEVSRIRSSFANVPDAPVSKFVLDLKGGPQGLLENSANVCKSPQRARVIFTAQNGRSTESEPQVATSCRAKRSALKIETQTQDPAPGLKAQRELGVVGHHFR
jgi:hypothetical protein